MSDYKVGPVQLAMAVIGLKSGDEVKLDFEWMVKQRALPELAPAGEARGAERRSAGFQPEGRGFNSGPRNHFGAA